MLRLLSWSSGLGAADKVTSPDINMLATHHHRSPSAERMSLPKLKRKRVDSDATEEVASPNKRRVERVSHVLVPEQSPVVGSSFVSLPAEVEKQPAPVRELASIPVAAAEKLPAESSTPNTMGPAPKEANKEKLRRTIQAQIGLEILLKHDELRLIDQELAKCQIALEQLRRCSEIPYPASRLSQEVSMGRGPSLRSSFTGAIPSSPAPWGVTDGPYSRHYAKWLLPDPRFDGGQEDVQAPLTPAGKTPVKGRSTRGHVVEVAGAPSSSRSQRGGKLKALSSGYPQPKDKAGLVIQKRKSDGATIKLVCLDCRRENFSSAQGFINHCRIAHNRSFASHDAAADACGEPVEVDEAGSVVGNEMPSTPAAGMVHPLIRSAHLLKQKDDNPPSTSEAIVSSTSQSAVASASLSGPKLRGGMGSLPPTYRASPLTPHLSALVQSQGLGLDLDQLVSAAKAPALLEESSDEDSGEDEDSGLEETHFHGRHPQVAGSKQPARGTASPIPSDRPNGIKSAQRVELKLHNLEHLDTPTTIPHSASQSRQYASPPYSTQEVESLEPSPTNESNQAPSLVDDDDDYEAHSPSLSSSVSEDQDDADLAFEIQDDEPSGPSTRAGSLTESEYNGTPKVRVLDTQRRRPSALRRDLGDREEKHVSFVSPSPARELHESSRGAGKKGKRASKEGLL